MRSKLLRELRNNRRMPSKTKPAARMDTTPVGRLSEAKLQQLVGYQLAQASITTKRVFTREVGQPLGLRRVEYTILMLIKENPGCSASRLSRALDITAPNLTILISRLEQQGLVVREQNEIDKRSLHLHVSTAGAQLATETTERLLAGEQEALSSLSFGERALFIELLHKVASGRA
ncbi:hypothetical protein BH09PSE5_BH09PSE5_34360 [soil metagenome]